MGHFTLLNLGIFTLLFLTFGKRKLSKSLFFYKKLNFDFLIWAIYHQKKEKAIVYTRATFFPSDLVQNCNQKSLKKIILLHILKNFTEFDKTSKKSSPDLDRLLALSEVFQPDFLFFWRVFQ